MSLARRVSGVSAIAARMGLRSTFAAQAGRLALSSSTWALNLPLAKPPGAVVLGIGPPGDFIVVRRGHHIGPTAQLEVQVIAYCGVGQHVDAEGEGGGEESHAVTDPTASIFKGLPGGVVAPAQEGSPDAAGNGMNALDFGWIEDVVTGFAGHGRRTGGSEGGRAAATQ